MTSQYQVYSAATHQRMRTLTTFDEAVKFADAHKIISGTDAYILQFTPVYTTHTAADDFARPNSRPNPVGSATKRDPHDVERAS